MIRLCRSSWTLGSQRLQGNFGHNGIVGYACPAKDAGCFSASSLHQRFRCSRGSANVPVVATPLALSSCEGQLEFQKGLFDGLLRCQRLFDFRRTRRFFDDVRKGMHACRT